MLWSTGNFLSVCCCRFYVQSYQYAKNYCFLNSSKLYLAFTELPAQGFFFLVKVVGPYSQWLLHLKWEIRVESRNKRCLYWWYFVSLQMERWSCKSRYCLMPTIYTDWWQNEMFLRCLTFCILQPKTAKQATQPPHPHACVITPPFATSAWRWKRGGCLPPQGGQGLAAGGWAWLV